MKSFLRFLMIFSSFAAGSFASTAQQVYIKLKDANGKEIRGNSVTRGYENQIIASNFIGSKAKDPTVQFTMSVQAASGVLQALQQNETRLSTALVTATKRGEQGNTVLYTILLEDIEITRCDHLSDSNGNNSLVTLRPSRVGTTYYSLNRKSGTITVSSKSGYDYTSGKAWTNF